LVKRCLIEDEASGHLSLVHKHFAMGKVFFELQQYSEARDALSFAAGCQADRPPDYVQELLARTWLAMGEPNKALEIIGRVPEKYRKAYVRWTEADALCALREFSRARTVLHRAAERDSLGCHKTWIRLAKLEYLTRNFQKAMEAAADACHFFEEKYGNPYADGLFWHAASARQVGDTEKARDLTQQLRDCQPRYPKLGKLIDLVGLEEPPLAEEP
jgi:tetratricopeptide (TPR) repeat protein